MEAVGELSFEEREEDFLTWLLVMAAEVIEVV